MEHAAVAECRPHLQFGGYEDDHGNPFMAAATQKEEHKAPNCSSVEHLMKVACAVHATQTKRKASEPLEESENGSRKVQAVSHDVLRAVAMKAREMMLGDARGVQELLAEFRYSSANGRLVNPTASFTPLQYAVMQGHENTARALIDGGATNPFPNTSTQPVQVQTESAQKSVPVPEAQQVTQQQSSIAKSLLTSPPPCETGVEDRLPKPLNEKVQHIHPSTKVGPNEVRRSCSDLSLNKILVEGLRSPGPSA